MCNAYCKYADSTLLRKTPFFSMTTTAWETGRSIDLNNLSDNIQDFIKKRKDKTTRKRDTKSDEDAMIDMALYK